MNRNIGWRKLALGSVVSVICGLLTACGGGGSTASSTWSGTKQLGVAGKSTAAYSIAADTDGNIYVAGNTKGGLDGNTLTGIADLFLTKYDRSGVRQFTKQLGVAGKLTSATSVVTDLGGNVYVVGYTEGGLDGNLQTGSLDSFLIKFNSSGIKQYTKQYGVVSGSTYATSVATDAGGNVYVVGSTSGGLDGNTLAGVADLFLTKFDSGGGKLYTKLLGVAWQYTRAASVVTSPSDANGSANVFVTGYTTGGLVNNTLTGTTDFFLTRFNDSGAMLSTQQFGAAGVDSVAVAVAADAVGNIFVAGRTDGGLDGNTLTGTTDSFLAKYVNIGVKPYLKKYTRQFGLAGKFASAKYATTDVGGNVYVAGTTDGGLDGNTPSGIADFYLAKFDNSGVKQYTRQLGVAGADTYANAVTTDASGNIFVAGYTNGGLDGNTPTGTIDFFVTKYNADGVKQ